MNRIIGVVTICTSICFSVKAQKRVFDHYSIAVSTMHTNFPFRSFSSLFTKEYHPGFEISSGFTWKEKPKHDYYQEIQFGYSYHRWVQHSVTLYTSAGYRYKFPKVFTSDISIGAGYLHAIADSRLFKLQNDGTYQKKFNWGRSQVMGALSIGIGKSFSSGKTMFLKYQQRLQTPFIRSYVPVLPANVIQLGITIPRILSGKTTGH